MKTMRAACYCLTIIAVLISLTGCGSPGLQVRPDATEYVRTTSFAIPPDDTTFLGAALMPYLKDHEGQSGFRLLETGTKSLDARLALIRSAEKTLDLQYYTINDDVTSNLLVEEILRASERGVRVRFLIDNINADDVAPSFAIFDKKKNIEIRIFNPYVTHDQTMISRMAALLTDLGQFNKRMHNKVLIADNQMAILGGRNLGDEYFDAASEENFKDLDILSAGPITARISKSFDQYWNDRNSFPIALLEHVEPDPDTRAAWRVKLAKNWAAQMWSAEGRKKFLEPLERFKAHPVEGLIWAKAELAADRADKIETPAAEVESRPLDRLVALANTAQSEFIIVSPYFVPQDNGVQWLGSLIQKGVAIRILTNSLASTDVVAVHTGYKRYRKALVEKGAALYELKAIGGDRPDQRPLATEAPPTASLHAKVYVIDRETVFIGSFNMDPRSANLNTEIALAIYSPVLADRIVKMFEIGVTPDYSYRVALDPQADYKDICWLTKQDGRPVRYRHEPNSGFWRSVQTFVISALPIEEQL